MTDKAHRTRTLDIARTWIAQRQLAEELAMSNEIVLAQRHYDASEDAKAFVLDRLTRLVQKG